MANRHNRVLGITAKSIPYIKELRPIAGSVTSAILWQQLEYWFMIKDYQSFYKFSQPCEHDLYRQGDSWTEELGFSVDEFRSAFDKIGIRYESMNAFNKVLQENNQDMKACFIKIEGEKVYEKMYISVYDRIKKTTAYYRNHDLIDKQLDIIFNTQNTTTPPPPLLRNEDIPIYVNGESQFTVNGLSRGVYTENTNTDNTTDNDLFFFLPFNYICKNFEEARARAREFPKEVYDKLYKNWNDDYVTIDLSFLGIFSPLQIVSYQKLSKVTLEQFEGLKTHYNTLKSISHLTDPKIGGWDYFQIVNEKFMELHAEYSRQTSHETGIKSHQEIMDWAKQTKQ